jgi:hypothetical protein
MLDRLEIRYEWRINVSVSDDGAGERCVQHFITLGLGLGLDWLSAQCRGCDVLYATPSYEHRHMKPIVYRCPYSATHLAPTVTSHLASAAVPLHTHPQSSFHWDLPWVSNFAHVWMTSGSGAAPHCAYHSVYVASRATCIFCSSPNLVFVTASDSLSLRLCLPCSPTTLFRRRRVSSAVSRTFLTCLYELSKEAPGSVGKF